MPLYEYQCESCEHRFEKIQKYTDPAPDGCPKCGSAVRKLASSPAIQFKGTGWYITDYAKKSGSDSDSGKSGTGKSANSDSSGGGDKSDSGSKSDTSSTSQAGAQSDSSGKSSSSDKSGSAGKSSADTTSAKRDSPPASKET